MIGDKRVGGYDPVRERFGKKTKSKNDTTYQPVIAILSVALLMALGFSWAAS